ncbi:alpha/beta-hydrolase [Leucogyrophana mollusca]|uniref:Alpha/beta-hydrolase n=1 Tax=Leucogyrophana mollusca TaxID=85980 RepID=A0ACB8BGR0_9AGAM|nr:alpha/beta-hydrolase [Leucogyrophana mollusca]
MLGLLPFALRVFLGSFLWRDESTSSSSSLHPVLLSSSPRLTFHLRHQHAVVNSSQVIFSDFGPLDSSAFEFTASPNARDPAAYNGISTVALQSHRPQSQFAFHSARFRSMQHEQSEKVHWHTADVHGPNVDDRETLLTLAKMTNNAYYERVSSGWYDLHGWNRVRISSYPFGWEYDADGFRGHIFVADDNSTVVLTIKGTTLSWLVGGGGPTVTKDKFNDNLLFSCCCARVGPTWSPVCDCFSGGYKCDQTCLEKSLVKDSLFYNIGTNLYNNVTYMYPHANIWVIGHSLGGSLASLLGATFGAPAVAFEAPAEKLAASRLHLPSPPSAQPIFHVYNTADPIAMGVCNGVTSACAIGGYAMETRCHLGKVARYDSVSKLGWSVSVRKHSIKPVIEELLSVDWDWDDGWNGTSRDGPRTKRPVPPFIEEKDCMDCYSWEFGDFK